MAEDNKDTVSEDKSDSGPSEAAKDTDTGATESTGPQMPQINFPTFVLSLNASALVHLGAIEDPASGSKAKNLTLAKQTIDILSMLQEKTRGNLEGDEEKMLRDILYDLRIIYVREKG